MDGIRNSTGRKTLRVDIGDEPDIQFERELRKIRRTVPYLTAKIVTALAVILGIASLPNSTHDQEPNVDHGQVLRRVQNPQQAAAEAQAREFANAEWLNMEALDR